jgi:hypothetical protein
MQFLQKGMFIDRAPDAGAALSKLLAKVFCHGPWINQ